ncbi:alpha/beta fold hydrolase [Amycolatopsis sp. w19]|uniref:alpha/beta fold hydrolase n=1 Tax=Amycolatopsis sp. w19 TaxID=3448134 RepID=UPI003F1C2BE5
MSWKCGLVSIALVAGCTTSQGSPAPVTKVDEPEHEAALTSFHRQTLDWRPCDALQCAKLTVPVDYRRPDGPKFTLPVIKAAPTRPGERIGTLVAGAGGPGQSGVAMVKDIAGTWPAPVRARFDLVGFDPRGIGGSEPRLRCDTEGEPASKAPEGLPVIGAEVPSTRQYAEACLKNTGENVLRHLGTDDVVSDLDVLRVVTGQEKLTYLGYSYGTRIGQLYADRFPKKVRAMVLDGVDNTYLDWRADTVEQAKGVEDTLLTYAKQCAIRTGKPCPGHDETEILSTVDRVLAKADKADEGSVLRSEISPKLTFPADWAELSEIILGADAPSDEVLRFVRTHPDTLVIIGGDHETGGLSIENYDASDTDPDQDGPFDVPGSKLRFTVDWTTHDHTGADTPITAEGPGSTRLGGTVENTDVYWVMRLASGL